MNRGDFQDLAELRLKEAECLLQAGFYNGAYYLAGYSVECALKACIAKQVKQYDFPDNRYRQVFTQNLEELLTLSGLRSQHQLESGADPQFERNWLELKDWSEENRYEINKDKRQATDIFNAVADEHSGILPWLKKYW